MTPKNKYEFRSLTDVASLDDKTIVGKAICFNDPTCLMEIRGQKYFEVIQPTALDKCNLKDVVLKYNHDNNSQILARTRNKSLELDILPKTAISIPVVKKVTLLLYASSPNLSFSQ